MNYAQTLEFLFSYLPAYHRIGKAAYKNNLDSTLALDAYFCQPHLKYRTIHIAGTNGKGSLSHMIASVLQEAGCRTGLYTSPHLKDFRERIKVSGKMIPKGEVTAFVKKNQGIIGSVHPSFFEMTAAMAFDYFEREKVDVAVIETGMGGRLDSTNIITPVISVITNIGHDHMDLLGGSMESVAVEKAGIIKKNVPVVIGETQQGIRDMFISRAIETGSDIYFADTGFACMLKDPGTEGSNRQFIVKYLKEGREISGVIPLGGDYQAKNLQTLFQVFTCIRSGFKLSEASLVEGIRKVIINTGLKGRWQVLRRKPLVICDTGHNREGLEYVIRQLGRIRAGSLHFVIGFVSDKDLSLVLPLFPKNAKYYFTRASVPRALDEKILQKEAAAYGLTGESYSAVKKAFEAAISDALPADLVFIGGSTFVVAEVV
jgi:dihydrofolate synthase/folylpolyglutamate synthase